MTVIGAVGAAYRPSSLGAVREPTRQLTDTIGPHALRNDKMSDDWLSSEDFLPDATDAGAWQDAEGAFARLLQRLYSLGSAMAASACETAHG